MSNFGILGLELENKTVIFEISVTDIVDMQNLVQE